MHCIAEYKNKTDFDIDVKRSEEEPKLQTVARHTTGIVLI